MEKDRKSIKNYAPGERITVRGEDFLIKDVVDNHGKSKILKTEGISELVRAQTFIFDTSVDKDIEVIDPANSNLVPDTSGEYRLTKLFLETHIRNSTVTHKNIIIGHKAAINGAEFQMTPTLKAYKLPRPRLLIADAVGLGKTIEVGVFLAEQIKRGKGKRILVLALKSILTQFQQEIWHRFAIPLVRLDSIGIQRIKAELPANKNPFDYYDKTIISIDTLKNNAKFRHYIERSHWDIIVIDECHTVANISSQRGDLAQYLATKCESLILTSATPHNGSKESFANLITMIEPTAIPRVGDYTKEDVLPYYVRRFKKDIKADVQENFKDREVLYKDFSLTKEEVEFFEYQQELKITALKNRKGSERSKDLLFSIGLFKACLSSPEACLETVNNKLKKLEQSDDDETENLDQLVRAKELLERVIDKEADSKYAQLLESLKEIDWKGRKSDPRIIIFAERIATIKKLEKKLKAEFGLEDETIVRFDGSLNDVEQQRVIDDFGKEDSDIRLFLSSDAGSQGVNLHFYCNIMFNYDIPWSIITLEQRNGRIDRYGQKNTPYIYYLISKSDKENIEADLRIIKKLGEKEDEIHRVLGDASSFLKKYDAEQEEKAVEDILISGDTSTLDNEINEFDWNSIFDSEQETTEVKLDTETFANHQSFFKSDFEFYKNLSEHLVGSNSIDGRSISISDELIEVLNEKEIDSYLYDLPPEAKPKRGNFYKLSPDKDLVQRAIDNSRKKKGEWAEFQMLYDLHPIVKVFMTKLEANIDKDVSLVVKTERIEKDTIWYIFHGQIANNLGQSIVSEFFVVGLKNDGTFIKVIKFNEFIEAYNLTEQLLNEQMEDEELRKIKRSLSDAITNAEMFYLNPQQEKLKLQLENQLDDYKTQLNNWYSESKNQLALEFEDKTMTTFTKTSKEKKEREIETILSEKSQFYKDLTSLDNHPYIKLLAVFYN